MRTETGTETKVCLWDIAGVDGLQAMKSLIGETIDRIAPFQSLEARIGGEACSILRLCEGNFRVSCRGKLSRIAADLDALSSQQVWIKEFDWLGALILPEATAIAQCLPAAIPKPPHRLENLPLHCAVPARIHGISVLIWRHPIGGKSIFELHAAQAEIPRLQRMFEQL